MRRGSRRLLGLARPNSRRLLISGAATASGTIAFDVGGGLDMKILPHTSLRGQIRDFNSGGLDLPSLLSTVATGRQNNLFVTGGIAVRF